MNAEHVVPRDVRTQDICDQLQRYGNEVCDDDLLDALWACTDINDDLCHGRHPSIVLAAIGRATAALGVLSARISAITEQDTL